MDIYADQLYDENEEQVFAEYWKRLEMMSDKEFDEEVKKNK